MSKIDAILDAVDRRALFFRIGTEDWAGTRSKDGTWHMWLLDDASVEVDVYGNSVCTCDQSPDCEHLRVIKYGSDWRVACS